MGFEVAQIHQLQTAWYPVAEGLTVYNGALVEANVAADLFGLQVLTPASGVWDTSNRSVPFGIVLGNNNKTPVYSATYQAEYITATAAGSSHGDTTEFVSVEGPWSKGDPIAMVKVALIDATTIIKGPIYNAAVGVAPTELEIQAGGGNTSGLAGTTDAADAATVDQFSTIYFRSGNNMGVYRRTTATASTTVHTWTRATPYDNVAGDKCVVTNLNAFGTSRMQTDATGCWIEASAAVTTHYFQVHVIRLDLSVAGKEYCEFKFSPIHFAECDEGTRA